MTLYVDGAPAATTSTTEGTYVAMENTGYDLDIGRRGSGGLLQGLLDDVRIYDRALTPTEVLDLYNGY